MSRLLVVPVGLSVGVLYSAVRHTKPDEVWVITSKESAGKIPEAVDVACEHEGMKPPALKIWTLKDPFLGFKEIDWNEVLNSPECRNIRLFTDAIVSMTGGTSAMQYLAEKLARALESRGMRVARVALIDRRSTEIQRKHPYVLGEIYYIED